VLHQPAPLARAEFNLFFLLSKEFKNYKSTHQNFAHEQTKIEHSLQHFQSFHRKKVAESL